MQSTYKQQIEAIQKAREICKIYSPVFQSSVLLEALEDLINSVEEGRCEYSQLEKARKVVFQVRQNSIVKLENEIHNLNK